MNTHYAVTQSVMHVLGLGKGVLAPLEVEWRDGDSRPWDRFVEDACPRLSNDLPFTRGEVPEGSSVGKLPTNRAGDQPALHGACMQGEAHQPPRRCAMAC